MLNWAKKLTRAHGQPITGSRPKQRTGSLIVKSHLPGELDLHRHAGQFNIQHLLSFFFKLAPLGVIFSIKRQQGDVVEHDPAGGQPAGMDVRLALV